MDFTRDFLKDQEVGDLVKIANLHFGLGVNKNYTYKKSKQISLID